MARPDLCPPPGARTAAVQRVSLGRIARLRVSRRCAESPKCDFGPITEDCVDAARVEAECREAVLEVGDIIAAQHRQPEVEQPVAEAVARADEGRPGLGVADPVSGKVALPLETRHRGNR